MGDEILRKGRRHPGEQIEDDKFGVAELVFDIVPKDPQKQHIAAEVQPATMHEHRRENGDGIGLRMGGKSGRNESPMVDEPIAAG
jgi:hypothetical protein